MLEKSDKEDYVDGGNHVGRLPVRVYMTPTWEDVKAHKGKYHQTYVSPYLSMDRLKIFSDGALG